MYGYKPLPFNRHTPLAEDVLLHLFHEIFVTWNPNKNNKRPSPHPHLLIFSLHCLSRFETQKNADSMAIPATYFASPDGDGGAATSVAGAGSAGGAGTGTGAGAGTTSGAGAGGAGTSTRPWPNKRKNKAWWNQINISDSFLTKWSWPRKVRPTCLTLKTPPLASPSEIWRWHIPVVDARVVSPPDLHSKTCPAQLVFIVKICKTFDGWWATAYVNLTWRSKL